MAQHMLYTFVLFGPRKGKTLKLANQQFVNGVCQLSVDPAYAAFVMKNLGYYHAYAKGTPEYEAAVTQEQKDGTSEVDTQTQSRVSEKVRSGGEPKGGEPSPASAAVGSGHDDSENGSAGQSTSGDGHEDARISKFEESKNRREPVEPKGSVDPKLAKAIKALDPENPDHWVATGPHAGKPKLSAVETAYGKAGVTRADVEDAAPGYTKNSVAEVDI